MAGSCSTHGCIHTRIHIHIKFWSRSLKEIHNSEDLGIDGKMLKWILGS